MQVGEIGIQNAMNGALPCEGPKVLPYAADFNASTTYDFDLTQQFNQKAFTTLQGLFCDNSANGSPVTVTVNGTGQTFTIKKNTCGFYILLMPDSGPKFSLASAGAVSVYFAFLNYYVPPEVWDAA